MDAPHFIGQLWQLSRRVRIVSMVPVHSSWTSSVQKSLLRSRALPHTKLSVCHFSSSICISCGDPSPAKIGITPGIGFSSRFLMYFSASLQCSMNSPGRAMWMSFDPRTAMALRFLSPMTAPTPSRLALARPCSMEAKKTLCSPARPMDDTCTFGSPSSWRMSSAVSSVPKPLKWVASRISTLSSLIHR